MENSEIRALLEGFETVWQRVSTVPENATEVQVEVHQCAPRVTSSLQTEIHQPRWFCVF